MIKGININKLIKDGMIDVKKDNIDLLVKNRAWVKGSYPYPNNLLVFLLQRVKIAEKETMRGINEELNVVDPEISNMVDTIKVLSSMSTVQIRGFLDQMVLEFPIPQIQKDLAVYVEYFSNITASNISVSVKFGASETAIQGRFTEQPTIFRLIRAIAYTLEGRGSINWVMHGGKAGARLQLNEYRATTLRFPENMFAYFDDRMTDKENKRHSDWYVAMAGLQYLKSKIRMITNAEILYNASVTSLIPESKLVNFKETKMYLELMFDLFRHTDEHIYELGVKHDIPKSSSFWCRNHIGQVKLIRVMKELAAIGALEFCSDLDPYEEDDELNNLIPEGTPKHIRTEKAGL